MGDEAESPLMSHVMDPHLLDEMMSLLQLVRVGGPNVVWESGNDRELKVG